ncbi:Cellulose synthase-like D3 [Hibiscus syriacus]|uniref:Cellulose synthase-like D3 n=1 Tax=Hibiscus syriacus TaxID=106335 RepID=A0A6A2WFU8_HIBSY|nr:Cellulose synthase-like D3 [Hibiscus syriacus]
MGCVFSQFAAKFAFFPPSPPTYQVKKGDNGKLTVVSSSSTTAPVTDDPSLDVLLIDTKRGNKIVGFYLKNPHARLTVLYSHGNAADLGQLYDLYVQLKVNLRVNLMGYDYSGYGASTGKPSESNTYADIEAVYQCLQTEYGVSQEDLILYGQSVGSGPTLHLAAKLPRLRGVVLHSGILSGLRVLCHVKFSFCFDIYQNINKIQKVKCPVLVIHLLHELCLYTVPAVCQVHLSRMARKMMLSIGCMEMDFGKWQGNHTSLCGSKEVVTATWSYTLITFAIFASSFMKWRTRRQQFALKGFGRVSIYRQGQMATRLPVRSAVRLNYANLNGPNVQNQDADAAGGRRFFVGHRNGQNAGCVVPAAASNGDVVWVYIKG